MRLAPENSFLLEEFEDEIDYVKVWEEEFPVKRGDNIKARHFNSLWAALTERGRLVGLQVHDWTIGEVEPGSMGSPGTGSEGNEWNFPLKGMVRPNDELYWDGYKNEGDTEFQQADEIQIQHINDLLTTLDEVCKKFVNPESDGLGFLGVSDLLAYLKIGKSINPEAEAASDEFSGEAAIAYDAWGFPVIPDRTESSTEDRFWYNRNRLGAPGFDVIEINDPMFESNSEDFETAGGAYGEAQYLVWPQPLPTDIDVKIAPSPGQAAGEETVSKPLIMFHEHINAIYYMIRALEYVPYKIAPADPAFPKNTDIVLNNDKALRTRITSQVVCDLFQAPRTLPADWESFRDTAFKQNFVLQSIDEGGGGGTLLGTARQQTGYFCFGTPSTTDIWAAVNIKESRFVHYIPMTPPWDDPEISEFPGGFAFYKVEELIFWTDATLDSNNFSKNTGQAGFGWGGDAVILLEGPPFNTPNNDNDIVSGEEIERFSITANEVIPDKKSGGVVMTALADTVEKLETPEDNFFSLHINLDPEKWKHTNDPTNETPKRPGIDVVDDYTFTESSIIADILCATKFEEFTYPGGRVAVSDMEL